MHSEREIFWHSEDGLRLCARLYESPHGARDPGTVLCLHGLTRNSRDFEILAPHLSARYRVIAPDLRGRGFSDWDPKPQNYNPGVYLDDILTLLGITDAMRVAIIGTSLGGMLGMRLAHSNPERIIALILNDIGPEIDPRGLQRIKTYAGTLPNPSSWTEAIATTKEVYWDAWRGVADDQWAVLARRGYRENAAGAIQVDADRMIGEVLRNAPTQGDLWPAWPSLRNIPTLAIRGAHSDILSEATFARMRQEKPDLEQLTVPERGHSPLLDEAPCIRAIDALLQRAFG
jgi:pimeloyl-ACP methyl ester carboxylesterase